MAVVDNSNLLNAVKSVPGKLDPDLFSVCIERVPNQFDESRDWRGSSQPLQVLLIKFNVKVHDGAESRNKSGG